MSGLGNKAIIAKNIKYYMDLYDKTRNDMCEDLGVKYTTFSDWVNGKSYPRIDKIELMANYFGIEKSDLIESKDSDTLPPAPHAPPIKGESDNIKPRKAKGVKIPVLGRVAAGVPIEAIEEIIDYEEITEDLARTGEFFCLVISGDSMAPRMLENDIVVVKKQSSIESGEIAVVMVNGCDATVKKVVRHENGISLIATNQAYSPKFFTNDEVLTLPVGIIGKVVELRGKF